MPLRATVTWINISAQDYRVKSQSFDNPVFNETVALGDVVGMAFVKPITSTTTMVSSPVFSLNKFPTTDIVTIGDNIITATVYKRLITSTITLSDVVNSVNAGVVDTDITTLSSITGLSFSRPIPDTVAFSDLVANLLAKIELSTFGFTDSEVLSFGKNQPDSVTVGDSDIFEFGKNEPDSLTVADSQTFSHAKVLGSAFTLSSLVGVGNEFLEDDTDLLSFSDTIVISRVHGRALGNMVLGSTTFN